LFSHRILFVRTRFLPRLHRMDLDPIALSPGKSRSCGKQSTQMRSAHVRCVEWCTW
jgi:hypothetical protein